MTLRKKQSLFVKLLGRLFLYAEWKGYKFTIGDAWDTDRVAHSPNSLHYIRLAIDLNLFVNGVWIRNGDHVAWKDLGQFWESLHELATWGGKFNDANHFSITHEGRR